MSILLTNIQRFSLHDGPGIRTTVFLKGCNLCCPWCSNPENMKPIPESYIKDGIKGTYGKSYSPNELYAEIIKDKTFYSNEIDHTRWHSINEAEIEKLPGGVTFSGGECLLQIEELEPLLVKLKKDKIHIAVETSLFAPENNLSIALNYINLFYVDIKVLDYKKCKEEIKGNLDLYLCNLDILMKSHKPVIIRIPVIGGFTDDEANRRAVKDLLKASSDGNILKIELIKEHNLGFPKYQSLIDAGSNIKLPINMGVSDEMMETYKTELDSLGIEVEVCKI